MVHAWTAYRSRLAVRDREVAIALEYALWGALIAVVVIAAALFLGQ